jgi:cation transport regulator
VPYESIDDLPKPVRDHLPPHAAEIYRSAFNHAWSTYADRGEEREEIAHRVAWAAVKRRYQKVDDFWMER